MTGGMPGEGGGNCPAGNVRGEGDIALTCLLTYNM